MNAFIDANGVLQAWGFMDENHPDETAVPVDDSFNYDLGSVQYVNDEWIPYSAPVDHTADNTAERDALMATANTATYGMSDAYVAGLLDDADTTTFKAWATYKLALSKVDMTQATPVWPVAPSAQQIAG